MEKTILITGSTKGIGLATDEIAYAIEFFLNEKSGFITGQTLFIDGGGSI